MPSGLVYVFTGEGKGKTSAALGVATRSLLLGERVIWIALYKQEKWGLAEAKLTDKFSNLEMIFTGLGFSIKDESSKRINESVKVAKVANGFGVVVDSATEGEHRQAAHEALQLAQIKLLDKPFLLVIDEVLNALSEGLVSEQEVISLVESRGKSHVVLTGRGLSKGILQIADLVTECSKIKHPYDQNKLAVRGLDF